MRSAWIPAPPPESEPAIVYTMEGAFGMVSVGVAEKAAADDNEMATTSGRRVDRKERKLSLVEEMFAMVFVAR